MNTYQIIVNQNQNTAPIEETKKEKHPGRVAAGLRLAQWNRENKDKPRVGSLTLKKMLQYFKKDLHDPAAILTAVDETIRILEENNIEIRITLKKI